MATAAAVERFKAAGKQQLNVWVDSDTAAVLKTLSVQRGQSYGDVIRDALVSLHSGQQVAPVRPDSGGDSIDRLVAEVAVLREEVASQRSIVGDVSSAFESRLSDLQDDLEARLQRLEATISAAPVLPMPVQQTAPETPAQAVPGGKKTPVKRAYTRSSNEYRAARDQRFLELHHQGMTPAEIGRAVKGDDMQIGTSSSNIHDFLKEQGLTPHSSRKRKSL